MPDYRALFGTRDRGDRRQARHARHLDAAPARRRRDDARRALARSRVRELRDFLANRDTPIAWSATKGGLLGKRSGKLFPRRQARAPLAVEELVRARAARRPRRV